MSLPKKISQLEEAIEITSDDYLAIVDNSDNTTKKITKKNLLKDNQNIFLNEIPENISFVNANVTVGSGDTDLYTCPAGKKAIVNSTLGYNTAGSTTTYIFKLKSGNVYYRLTTSGTIVANSNLVLNSSSAMVLNEGESFSINTSQAGLIVYPDIIEFDDTSAIKTSRVLSVSSGDNVVYTAPLDKTAYILGSSSIRTSQGLTYYFNSTISPRVLNWFLSQNQSSSGALKFASSAGASPMALNTFAIFKVSPGYSIILNIDSAGGTAWVNVLEV